MNDFLLSSNEGLWPLLERSFDGVVLLAPAPWQVSRANSVAAECFGVTEEELIGRRAVELFDDASRNTAMEHVQRAWVGDADDDPVIATVVSDAGEFQRVELRASVLSLDEERFVGLVFRVAVSGDRAAVGERQRVDPLTGLHDRDFFLQRMELLLRNATGSSDDFAVLFVDLDNFKAVNDRYGHLVADRVLREAAWRLAECVGPTNCVVRYGGDEFVVLIEGTESRAAAETLARRVRDAIAPPIALAEGNVSLSASVGIASGAPEYRTPEDVLAAADRAMYAAKRR